MVTKSGKVETLLLLFLELTLMCLVSGCTKSAKLSIYMRPESLYLCDKPYSRLYIEIDSVEGVGVPYEIIDNLKEFLSAYCSKPDGIEIIRDKPIPVMKIKDMPMGPASILYMDGPDPNGEPQPAYLHVFVYDTDIVFKRAVENPFVPSSCPCTVFFNVDYAPRWIESFIRHETGHILGLCKNNEHGDGVHCENSGCLMNDAPDLLSQLGALLVRPSIGQLCDDCQNDLRSSKSEETDPDLTFNGPFLMRREEGYSVASLSYCVFLVWPSIEETFDWQEGLKKIKDSIKGNDFKQEYSGHKGPGWMFGVFSPDNDEEYPQNMVETLGVLTNAAEDPNPAVRSYALMRLERLRQKQSE